jgi:hypothetical protein
MRALLGRSNLSYSQPSIMHVISYIYGNKVLTRHILYMSNHTKYLPASVMYLQIPSSLHIPSMHACPQYVHKNYRALQNGK